MFRLEGEGFNSTLKKSEAQVDSCPSVTNFYRISLRPFW